MGNTLIIRAFDMSIFKRGESKLYGSMFDDSVIVFPGLSYLSLYDIDYVIGINANKEGKAEEAKILKVFLLDSNPEGITIKFQVKGSLKIQSEDIERDIRRTLIKRGSTKAKLYIPLWCLLDSKQTQKFLNNYTHDQIRELLDIYDETEKTRITKNWAGIYNKFKPIYELPKSNPLVWEDVETLNIIDLACRKLLEIMEIPQDKHQSDIDKDSLLEQQILYGIESELLQNRCADLAPNISDYWSSIAYLHFMNAQELVQKDIFIKNDIESAIKYFDMAIDNDSERITDYYKKGYLLTRILPQRLLGINCSDSDTEYILQKRKEGIKSFYKMIKVWKSAYSITNSEYGSVRIYWNEYVKAYYHLGQTYYDMITNDWDNGVFVLNLRSSNSIDDKVDYNPKDLENMNLALQCFYKCWQLDRKEPIIIESISQLGLNTPHRGMVEGIDKLYWLGKCSFAKYWILSGYGEVDTHDALKCLDKAYECLNTALDFIRSEKILGRSKDIVTEMLAKIYICRGEFQKSVEIVKEYCSNSFAETNIANVLSLALFLLGNYKSMKSVLSASLKMHGKKISSISNFLIGCVYLNQEDFDIASVLFTKAIDEAKECSKENIDTILLALSSIKYRLNEKDEAIECLSHAIEINPYRLSIHKQYVSWHNSTPM